MKIRKKAADKINMITLGCSKNAVDSERLVRQLTAHSLEVVHNADISDARTIIINTCGFIRDAKQESIDTILHYAREKQKGSIDRLFVIGCLSERYRDDLAKELPEVDEFFGVNDLSAIIKTVGYNFRSDLVGERVLSTPPHYAYFKVSEGCNRRCSFCAIPMIRGKYRSKTLKELEQEAGFLAAIGVKELLFIAQDLSFYGFDLYKDFRLADLIKRISAIKGIEWIRLHYAYPQNFPVEILSLMNESENVCRYLDIPFQHISDKLLKLMKRGHSEKQTYELIHKFRKSVPDIALRTSLIVGFPGETEKDFEKLCSFVKDTEFERLGVFAYSHEENTWAGTNLKDSIPDKIKKERVDEIMRLQSAISLKNNQGFVGNTLKVIVDRKEGDAFIGRTEFDSPEVDNEVIIQSGKKLRPGTFCNVKITDASEFDLFGSVE